MPSLTGCAGIRKSYQRVNGMDVLVCELAGDVPHHARLFRQAALNHVVQQHTIPFRDTR